MIDTIIVGAGPSGLCAAKTILQCDPSAAVRILESGSTIGGVWAKEKMYPSLKTNHLFGGMDFSDFAMPIGHGAKPGDHIPGLAVHEFLMSYARHFRLTKLIQFHTTVTEITREETGGWRLVVDDPTPRIMRCRKLIVAMGVNNRPHRPHFQGVADFGCPIIHSAELGPNTDTLLKDDKKRTIAVLGGGKSAYDAVHMASNAGKEVEWILRKSGKGPVWVFPMETKMGPFEVLRDKLPVTRFITFFSPCIWSDGFKWIRDLLQMTKMGNFITQFFWAKMHATTLLDCGYRNDPRTKVLEPEHSPFWYGTTGGSCKYLPTLFERIRKGQIRVHREDISHLSDHSIHLANGRTLHVDAMITATGFSAKPTMNFSSSQTHCELGIPTTEMNIDQQKFWANLDFQSDIEIRRQFPNLIGGAYTNNKQKNSSANDPTATISSSIDLHSNEHSPFRLFRSLAPPGLTSQNDHSLVFLGVFSNFANHARLEIQCLWAYAYLNHKLTIPTTQATANINTSNQNQGQKGASTTSIYEEASLTTRYSAHRTPFGHGAYFPDHVFDQLPYFDVLLKDLGLDSRRKLKARKGWWAELFEPYGVDDYKGLVGEWLALRST